jgi:hypothetical protein
MRLDYCDIALAVKWPMSKASQLKPAHLFRFTLQEWEQLMHVAFQVCY